MRLSLKIFTRKEIVASIPLFILSAIVVILDQWSKITVVDSFYIGESMSIINGFLKFTYVHNKGAAFSFGDVFNDDVRLVLFKIIPVFVGVYLTYLIVKSKEHMIMKIAYALILGGGTGNVADRIRFDYVVDFISVYHRGFELFGMKFEPWYFAIFNLADSAVSLAAILLIIDFFIQRKKEKALAKKENVS